LPVNNSAAWRRTCDFPKKQNGDSDENRRFSFSL